MKIRSKYEYQKNSVKQDTWNNAKVIENDDKVAICFSAIIMSTETCMLK